MQVQLNPFSNQYFTGNGPKRGARKIADVMTKLYNSAYQGELYSHTPDIIQVTAKMKDGTEVSGIANFIGGRFEGLSFLYEHARYRNEFCKIIMEKYNTVITKGKCLK